MAKRQGEAPTRAVLPGPTGRPAQRRRTRAAILSAATRLITQGRRPSVDDIAAAADVARRTVYMHFPTLDQLLLDATVGALSETAFDTAMAAPAGAVGGEDVRARVDAQVRALTGTAATTLPLGRKIIRLTVDAPPEEGGDGPRRGYRRVDWIERAVDPLRDVLSDEQYDRLVSALAIVVGWEALVVLRDVRGLSPEREAEVLSWAAASLVEAMLGEHASRAP